MTPSVLNVETWQAIAEERIPAPWWNGEDLTGKSVIVIFEGGAGDTIAFSRFLPQLVRRCASVRVLLPAALCRFVALAYGVHAVDIRLRDRYGSADFKVSVLNLMDICNSHLPTFQMPPCPKLFKKPASKEFNVGICWAGSPLCRHDAQRSTHVEDWRGILSVPDVQFHSFQFGPRASELKSDKIRAVHLSCSDYYDTAAEMSRMDLVISVDTSVIHLAGWLGVPAWLLAFRDYRKVFPWCRGIKYETMTVLEQDGPGEWRQPFRKAELKLKLLQKKN